MLSVLEVKFSGVRSSSVARAPFRADRWARPPHSPVVCAQARASLSPAAAPPGAAGHVSRRGPPGRPRRAASIPPPPARWRSRRRPADVPRCRSPPASSCSVEVAPPPQPSRPAMVVQSLPPLWARVLAAPEQACGINEPLLKDTTSCLTWGARPLFCSFSSP